MKIATSIALAVALTGASPVPQRPDRTASQLELVDLTGEFDRIWKETSDLPDDRRADAFEAAFARIIPGFYDPKRLADDVPAAKYQARVLRGLKDYPARRQGIQQVSRQFTALIGPAQRSFEQAFGPLRGYPPIYLVDSLGEFDGGTRDLQGRNRLMFGADMIAALHKNGPIQPFFHHELFHLLHARTFKGCNEVWCSLWSEGLAVYVAAHLNPGADDDALLLTSPVALRPAVEAHKREAICAVRQRLDSTASADIDPLFAGGGKGLSSDLPPRFAYYVGYLVASDLGRTRSLKQLAGLSNEQVKPAIEESLARMGDCRQPTVAERSRG